MSNLINPQILKAPPERVYIFPERLTKEEIGTKISKLHTMAREESDRRLYCYFDEVTPNAPIKYEICYPHAHLNLKKYVYEDFKVIARHQIATCEFDGNFDNLLNTVAQLQAFAKENGYSSKPPYSFKFYFHKKARFSKHKPKITMEVQVPIFIEE